MRADRLLSIMLLLKVNNGMTAKTLATKLEVSTRTIYRDIDALSMAGIPVYTQRGENGGCFLDEGYRLTLQDLTRTELEALFVNGASDALQALGLNQHANDSRLKLLNTLPTQQQKSIQQFQNRLYIDSQGWFPQHIDNTYLGVFQEAIWTAHKLQVHYSRFNGEEKHLQLSPYGLVVKANVWYVVGQSNHNPQPRTYRISRVKSAKILPHTFEIPSKFDLQEYWHAQKAQFSQSVPKLNVSLYVTTDLYEILNKLVKGRIVPIERYDDKTNNGWRYATVDFYDANEARAILMSFGNRIIIDKPDDLRDSIIAYAQSIVEMYQLEKYDMNDIT
ncbi:MAG: YafY family protein [Bacteroidota bacterium]